MTAAILDEFLKINDIVVPQDLIDNEVSMMVMEYSHKKKYESLASGGYFDLNQDDKNILLDEFRSEAFKIVKTRLLLNSIIESECFEISKEELETEAKAISIRQKIPIEMVKDFLGEELESLKSDLMFRKAMDFVIKNAAIK